VGLDPSPMVTLLANSLRRLVKPFKSGNSGRSERITIEPGDDTHQIDRRSDPNLLYMRFRSSQIPSTSQVKGAHPLRDGRFNPGPQSRGLLECFCAVSLPCCLQSGVLSLWPDGECSPLVFACGVDTIAETRAGTAIGKGKLDLDQVGMPLPAERSPAAARFSLWTGRLWVFPIEGEWAGIEALRGLSLPLGISWRRTYQLDPEASLAVDYHPGTHIACLHEMVSRRDIRLVQFLLNTFGHRLISPRCRGSGHMRDEVRQGLRAGFGEVNLLSRPQGTALVA
jgi:hypothetical protein